MIIRKIRPEELKRVYELFSIAFESKYECKDNAEEVYDQLDKNPKSREDTFLLDKYAAFEDDDRTMMSCIFATGYPMIYDGNSVKMTGVGGVSSLPQYRRRGGIKGCIKQMLRDIYDDGVAFSWLYPFSSNYYRKFGYEAGPICNQYELALAYIPRYNTPGHCELADRSCCDRIAVDVKTIYDKFAIGQNGMIDNEDWEYEFIKNADPYGRQVFTYVYYDGEGKPSSYMTCTKVRTDRGQVLKCSRFVFNDREGLEGILGLAATFASDHVSITFELPESLHIETMVREIAFGGCTMSRRFLGMVRVVNVEKVLEISRYKGSGRLTMKIDDPEIAENSGIFTVAFDNGKCISVEHEAEGMENETKLPKPDISMTIDQFSRFILGCSDIEGMEYLTEDRLTFNEGSRDMISRVFYHKPCYIGEYF